MLLACLLLATVCGAPHAQPLPASPPAVSASERKDLLDAARGQAQAQLHKPVRFVVKQLRRMAGWAFLHAGMRDDHDQPISYAGTRYASADRHGQKSANYDALLQFDHGRWIVRIDSVGATDVPWTNWSRDYGAPAALFTGDATD